MEIEMNTKKDALIQMYYLSYESDGSGKSCESLTAVLIKSYGMNEKELQSAQTEACTLYSKNSY